MVLPEIPRQAASCGLTGLTAGRGRQSLFVCCRIGGTETFGFPGMMKGFHSRPRGGTKYQLEKIEAPARPCGKGNAFIRSKYRGTFTVRRKMFVEAGEYVLGNREYARLALCKSL
jgi:hypothetical protein